MLHPSLKARLVQKARHSTLPLICAGFALVGSAAVQAQGSQSESYSLGGYIGMTDRHDVDATFGVEFEYRPLGQWSYGAIIEHTPDVVRSQDATLLLGTANFRPSSHPRLKLTGGAGVEFKDYDSDDVRFRAGAGYDLIIEGQLTITPRIAFDFGESRNSVVLGASANYRF